MCIDNYEGMIISTNQNVLHTDNLLFQITECDPLNYENITCANPDQIKDKLSILAIYPMYTT